MSVNDLSSYWMPFTANRQFKAAPRMIVGAQGLYFQTSDGREILDSTAGLWCSNAGHGHPHIVEAIQTQAADLDYAPPFQMGTPIQFALASRLVGMAPESFGQVFYCNSGSEAVETALKIALAYQRARGEGTRTRLIGRERGYHGINFGGISVGGIVGNRAMFGAMLAGVDHLRHTHDPERNRYSQGMPAHGADLADDLERMVALHGAHTIAACIVEPVACSTGVLVPPAGYLQRLREICDRHGIVLIFDEVITGFGRLGTPFAAQRFGVTPDIITMAKGLTNGTVPMGGVLTRGDIYDTLCEAAAAGAIELPHGYTYSGHPLACAAAMATLDVYQKDGLFERAAAIEPYWQNAIHSLRGTRHVTDIRNLGIIAGIELEAGPEGPGTRGFEVYRRCWEAGVLIRVTGDIVALSPPLTVEEHHIDRMVETLRDTLSSVD
ncbi:aspartate aminotransferase family protein [Altericroceibacterium spongiae]|uniref:Aspartate aminotransferase family protein n=1 Tax=Altericroceibacterium spongiae TaxID=2320269 RepID=A0A420EKL1_9SPHN|nr:aspartate aminotransferase family protein [Altericroceibacterium spongiae]RKF21228.1 aspartate aminotransferase family protein [Altericroceibacterium spongiae]